MRRIGRQRRKKQKKILIIGSLSLLLFLCVGYAAFSTNISLKAKGNIKDKSRVIQAWSNTDQTDFHSDYYKENIVSATFLDNADVPSNATESWNVSEDKTHGGVIAWVVPNNEDSTKYDLYIGAKDGVVANKDSSYLFSQFIGLEIIDFKNNFDTINAINMNSMFSGCISLVNIDLSSFDTRNVTNMYTMFGMWSFRNSSTALTEINISGWDVSNVTNMRDMFSYNPNLSSIIGLENLNTENVTNMQGMFAGCKSIKQLDLSGWNTTNVTNMSYMFQDCINLTSLILDGIITSNVTIADGMFYNCHNITELNLCSFDTFNAISMTYMFSQTSNLKVIYVGSKWVITTADTSYMFLNSGVSSVTTGQC